MNIFEASKDGDLEKVKYFLEKGVEVNSIHQDISGWTPLMYACYGDHYEVAKYLIEQGANLDIQSSAKVTALMITSYFDFFATTNLLLEHRANPNFKRWDGKTALDFAKSKLHIRLLFHKFSHLFEEDEKITLQNRKYRFSLSSITS